jgi:hypothetical protein
VKPVIGAGDVGISTDSVGSLSYTATSSSPSPMTKPSDHNPLLGYCTATTRRYIAVWSAKKKSVTCLTDE